MCFDSGKNVLIGQLVKFLYAQDLFSFWFVLVDISCVCDAGCSSGQEHFSLYVLFFFKRLDFF